jgi:uncharacterized membrane protein YfcA
MWELILPILGFFIGTVAAMTGVGGGIFIVPLLTLVYSFSPSNAVGTSITTIAFTATAATINYSKQKRIYYKTGLLCALATTPGAILGAYLTSVISPSALGLIFGIFLVLAALRIMTEGVFSKHKTTTQNKENSVTENRTEKDLLKNKARFALGVGLSFFAGLASGLLGIGGGVLLVPILTLLLAVEIHYAVATSMLTMIATSISGAAQHYALGNINFEYAILIAAGSILGAQLGAYTSRRLSGKSLRIIFGIILIIVSIQMILKFA